MAKNLRTTTCLIIILFLLSFTVESLLFNNAQASSFGYASIGEGPQRINAGETMSSNFTCSESGTMDNITAYSSLNGWLQYGLYFDNGTLIAKTEQVQTDGTLKWTTANFISPPAISAQTYRLAFCTINGTGAFYTHVSVGDQVWLDSASLPTQLTHDWGTFDNSVLSIFANYTASSVGDLSAPTYSGLSTSTTVAGASCQFNATFTDETALEAAGQYTFETNTTGPWVADSPVNFTSTPQTISVSKTLNSTVGKVIGYRWNFTDNAGNTNTTGILTLTTTDGTIPAFTSITSSKTLAGSSTSLSVNITDNVGVSHLIWSTNINGTWLNATITAFTSNPVTKALTLPSSIGTNFYAKVFANNTNNNWAVSAQANFTTTAAYIALQAKDKDGLNLPRAVTYSGTLPNGTAYSVTSSAAGLYSLQCSNGSLTVAVTWQSHTVKASSTIAVTANASSSLTTKIARLNFTTNYVLVSVNETTIGTPSYTVLGGWKIDNIAGSGQKGLVVDQANWVKTSNPLTIKIGGNSYDSTNWALSSNILTFPAIDFVAYAEPTIELIYEVSSGDSSGSSGSSGSVPTASPSGNAPLGANDFQISNLELGTIQPNSTVTATLHLRYSGSSYTFKELYLSNPFYTWFIQDSVSLTTYVLTNPSESNADVTLTFQIPADVPAEYFEGEIRFTVLDAFGASHTSNAVVSASVEGATKGFDFGELIRDNLLLVIIIVVAVLAVLGYLASKIRR